jgi:hypothetical protein
MLITHGLLYPANIEVAAAMKAVAFGQAKPFWGAVLSERLNWDQLRSIKSRA